MISTHSAPLGPVTLKASVGAAENLPLFSVSRTGHFIQAAQKNGWKFYAADALPPGNSATDVNFTTTSLGSPTRNHPCVLMLGGEGMGLRRDIKKSADYFISVEGTRRAQDGVDSLNVSVAAGLICEAFLRKPMEWTAGTKDENNATDMSHSSKNSVASDDKLF